MSSYHERKARRRAHYQRYVHGWKERACTACAGSGRYDSHGSPPCGACDGSGKERYRGEKAPEITAGCLSE